MDTYLQYSQMRFIYIQCVLLQFLRNGSTRCSTRSVTCTKNLSTFSYWHFLSNLLARQYCTAPLIFCLRITDSCYIVPTTSQKIKMPTKGTETCSFPHWWAWQPEIAAKKLWPFEFRFHGFFGVVLEADQGLPPFFRHLLDLDPSLQFQDLTVLRSTLLIAFGDKVPEESTSPRAFGIPIVNCRLRHPRPAALWTNPVQKSPGIRVWDTVYGTSVTSGATQSRGAWHSTLALPVQIWWQILCE